MSARSPKNSHRLRLIGLFLGGAIAVLPAEACQLDTNLPPIDLVIDFDVYAFEVAASGTTLELGNSGDTDCRVLISVETEAMAPPPFPLSGSGVSANVSLPSTEGALGEGSDPLHAGQTLLVIPPGTSRTETLDLFIDNFASVPAGTYTEAFRLTILTDGSAEPAERVDGSVTLVAPPRAQVNIAGTSASFGESVFNESVHFDRPQPGDIRDLFIQTRSNALSNLTITSENGGRMVRPDLPESWIGYSARLDGQTLDLINGTMIGARPMTGLEGVSLPLQIEIVSLEKAFAGDYEDTVHVEIVAY